MKSALILATLCSLAPIALDDEESAERACEPSTLGICVAGGEELGARRDNVLIVDRGRELELCSEHGADGLGERADELHAAADAAMAADQRPYYPLELCLVDEEALVVEGEHEAHELVLKNRLFRLCSARCAETLAGDALEAAFVRLDEAVAAAQRPDYPLENCAVNLRGALGSMGEPVELVLANRLVRFCCKNCEPRFGRDPRRYLPRLDEAWAPVFAALAESAGGDG